MITDNYPLISVILPVYNIEEYLVKCMNSLFCQTYNNLEFILVDDGSTDTSAKLCDEFAERDKRVITFHKKNGGLSDARNYGIQRANGDYITCVDPDDYVDEDFIEYLYTLVEKYQTSISICQHRVIKNEQIIHEYGSYGDELLTHKKCIERILYHDVIDTSAWAKLYKRELFNSVQYPVGKQYEDIATTYKLILQSENIAIGYESKYNYIVREFSIVNGCFNKKKFDLLEMTDKMGEEVLQRFPDLERAVLRRRVYARFSTLNQMLSVQGYEEERKQIIQFIKKNAFKVLMDSNAPTRDKVAIISLLFGYPLYRAAWIYYKKREEE